jgi:hypothetical protein
LPGQGRAVKFGASLQGHQPAPATSRKQETDMAGIKVKVDWDVRDYHINFLKDMAEKYGIKDEAKAMRVLIDYALQDGDLDLIFEKKNMRCIACGGVV